MPVSNFITLTEAKTLTAQYRNSKEAILDPAFKDRGVLPICETFDRKAFDVVLAKPDCVGLRMYFAMDTSNLVKLVIVGVNSKNEDMIADPATIGKDGASDDIIDQGARCPVTCPPSSPINP